MLIGFIQKYKVLHIVFWVLTTVSLAHEMQELHSRTLVVDYQYAVIVKLWQMAGVYCTVLVLLPRYLSAKRYTTFMLLTLGCTIASALLSAWTESWFTVLFVSGRHYSAPLLVAASHAFDTAVIVVLFVAATVLQNKYASDRRSERLEQERLEAELSLLKAQMNPHFLFNAINSVYVLIQEDREMASNVLLQFSSLLRYQLYECTASKVAAHKEFAFLSNYIELEKVRVEDAVQVEYAFPQEALAFDIAPLLLQPFVENAFKHVSRFSDQPNHITIRADVRGTALVFSAENTFDEATAPQGIPASGGIGLHNVRRRLELLYQNNYALEVTSSALLYSITLTLYDVHELPYSR